ncbi:MAG: Fe-S cluster assembly protein SufD [Bacteriovoracaceae bacterium]
MNETKLITKNYSKLTPLPTYLPSWTKELVTKAQATFKAQGFPNKSVEEYRKTLFKNFLPENPKLADKPTLNCMNELYRMTKGETNHISLVNGNMEASLSSPELLKNKMVILSLEEGFKQFEADIKEVILAQNTDTFLSNFGLSHLNRGLFIKVPRFGKVDLLQLITLASSEHEEAFLSETKIILLDEGSELTLLETAISCFYNRLAILKNTLVLVKKGARFTHIKVQKENAESSHLANLQVKLCRDGYYNSMILNLGAKFQRSDIQVALSEPGAAAHVNGLYALKDQQFSDFHTEILHQAPHTESDQLYKGVLDAKSHGVFNGKIVVNKEAQLTRSSQLNKNLLLSKTAHIDTEPQLLIHADDVKCSHGATIGNLDEDQVFYFQSRGISEEKAKKMLSHAFANDVFMKIGNEFLEKKMEKFFFDHYEKEVL